MSGQLIVQDFAGWHNGEFEEGRSRVIEGANWKIAFDGYLEGYHFASLHPETIHPRTPSNCMHYEGFGPNMRIGFPQRRIGEALRDVPRDQWGLQENNGFDSHRLVADIFAQKIDFPEDCQLQNGLEESLDDPH